MANGDWTLDEELAYFKQRGKPPISIFGKTESQIQEDEEEWLENFKSTLHERIIDYIKES